MNKTVTHTLVALALAWTAACAPQAPARAPTPALKPYANATWGFTAAFPTPPAETDTQASDGKPASFRAKTDDGVGGIDVVLVLDATASGKNLDEFTAEIGPKTAQGFGGDVAPPTNVATAEGVPGRELRYTKNGASVLVTRLFLSGGRLYEINAGAVNGPTDPAVTSFLSSFHILAGTPPLTSSAPAS